MSQLEEQFLSHWNMLAGNVPQPEREYRFDDPSQSHDDGRKARQWKFDFAWPSVLLDGGADAAVIGGGVAVEIEGGVWSGGRHTRGRGFIEDCNKYNQAALQGWHVLRFTREHLTNDPAGAVEMVLFAIHRQRTRIEDWTLASECAPD